MIDDDKGRKLIEYLVNGLVEVVEAAGQMPEGHLYAMLMGKFQGFSIDDFARVKLLMLATGKIKSRNHLLIAV